MVLINIASDPTHDLNNKTSGPGATKLDNLLKSENILK